MGFNKDNDCVGCETCINCGCGDYIYTDCDNCGNTEDVFWADSSFSTMLCMDCLVKELMSDGTVEYDEQEEIFKYDNSEYDKADLKSRLKEDFRKVRLDEYNN